MAHTKSYLMPVLIGGAVILLIGSGIRSSFGLFQIPIAAEFGWARVDYSTALALQALFWGIGQPIFGAFAEKVGDRISIIAGAVLFAIGLLLSAYAMSPLAHQALNAVVGLGIAGTGFGVVLAMVGRAASDENRSMALAVATAAGSGGQLVGPPAVEILLTAYPWQTVFIILAATILVTLVVLPLMRAPAMASKAELEETLSQILGKAFRDPSFTLIFIGFFSCGYQLAFVVAHFPAFITEFCGPIASGSLLHNAGITTTSALGAAALAGTGFAIDRHMTAEALGFARPMANSLDAVSARDFALEFLAAASICAMHLSRFAEELVIWSSAQFRFVELSDRFSTGSSIMPQKKNPDAAELIRAKIGRIFGANVALMMVMKGLPLAYSKDMQEDKEQIFDAADNLMLALAAMEGMVRDMAPQKGALETAAASGFSTATDLADWLVRETGLPFREANHVTGTLVAMAEARGCDLPDLTLKDLQSVHAYITEDVFSVLGVHNSVASRTSYGGTSPQRVREQIARWTEELK